MDGLSGAASLVALIEISNRVASLCFQYSIAVKDAKKDIDRLQGKISDLKDILAGLKRLLDGRDNTRLSTTHHLVASLKDCFLRLEKLKAQLDPGYTGKPMSRLGVRALKWPFTGKEVEKIVVGLERYEQTFVLALQVDQTGLILDFDQKIDLAKLPIAKGASFDSHMEEHNARCLENTRVELQRHIAEWAKDLNSRPLFWLNGMAGTGKSTIARSVARSFADRGQLGASFFFKRGESDRGNAARLFTTIAADLMVHIPGSIPGIRRVIDADPAIPERALKEQFERLILQPLSEMKQAHTQALKLVVIDALDECEREEDIRAILQLLAQTKDIRSVSVRIFLTSRPELPIRLGFKQISGETYQDLILHEVPKQTIQQDIALFLEHELGEIREQRSLSPYWPDKNQIRALVEMAIPLFIFAATACRYIGDKRGNPKKRLEIVLKYQTSPKVSQLDRTYLPVLNQLFDDEDEVERETQTSEFREIVGSIVVLESPLSIVSLAYLLGISREDIRCRLDLLHSVLSIPVDEDMPVRPLHLSFRNFLLDPQKHGKSPYYVNEIETHERLTTNCLQLMSSPKGLRQNICNLSRPGTLKNRIDKGTIDRCLQPELQYACRYWVHHLEQSKRRIRDSDPAYAFLHNYFLYWLEAMTLIGEASKSINMINSLLLIVDLDESAKIVDFLRDAKRFALRNRSILEDAPLQLYSSALIFAPEMSIIKKRFNSHIPKWITGLSKVETDWHALLETLEGHSQGVSAVAFSPDSQLVASAAGDSIIRLWDTATGACRCTLDGHSSGVRVVVFSPDGQLVASGSGDSTIRLWDAAVGTCCSTFKGHSSGVSTIAFSPDGQLVASGSGDSTVRLWDTATRSCRSTLEGHTSGISAVAFSSDGQLIASGSSDCTVRLWDAVTGSCRSILEGHSSGISAMAFSPSGQLIAAVSDDSMVLLWDTTTGSYHNTLEGHSSGVTTIAFSPDGQLIVSGSGDSTVRLWETATGFCRSTLESHSSGISAVVFSPDGQLTASAAGDSTIRLWEATTGSCHNTLEGHSSWVRALAFSPDGQLVASGSGDSTVRLWDAAMTSCSSASKSHSDWIWAVTFSPDGQFVASGSDDSTVRLWDAATGLCCSTLEGHSNEVRSVAYSPDGQLVASGSGDSTVRLWDATTGSCYNILEGHSSWVSAVAFSPDGQLVASGSGDSTIRLWDVVTGSCRSTLKGHSRGVNAIAFSSNGSHLITDKGQILLSSPLVDTSFYSETEPCTVFVSDQWVTSLEQRLLWLPADYRPTCTAVWKNFICLGRASGRISILEFNLESKPPQGAYIKKFFLFSSC